MSIEEERCLGHRAGGGAWPPGCWTARSPGAAQLFRSMPNCGAATRTSAAQGGPGRGSAPNMRLRCPWRRTLLLNQADGCRAPLQRSGRRRCHGLASQGRPFAGREPGPGWRCKQLRWCLTPACCGDRGFPAGPRPCGNPCSADWQPSGLQASLLDGDCGRVSHPRPQQSGQPPTAPPGFR